MSWWTKLRDKYVNIETMGLKNPERDRETRGLIKDQIRSYQEQTNIAKDQLAQIRNEQDVQKRRIEEKQIRSLRRNYRAANVGLLGVGSPATSDTTSKLGV